MSNKFAVLRIQKLKDTQGISGVGHHVARDEDKRKKQPDNIDASRTKFNRMYKGGTDALTLWKERTKGVSIRKNAVLAYDIIATYSNELDGHIDVDGWARANIKFLEKKFGKDNVLNAYLHKDETTTHMHFCVVPLMLDEYTGKPKLNARFFTGGSDTLSALQDDYYECIKGFGFERGHKGSRAKHTDLKEYYKRKSSAEDRLRKMDNKQLLAEATKSEIRIIQLKNELESYQKHDEYNKSQIDERDKRIAELESKIEYFKMKNSLINKIDPQMENKVGLELQIQRELASNENFRSEFFKLLKTTASFKNLLPSEQKKQIIDTKNANRHFVDDYSIDELPTVEVIFKEDGTRVIKQDPDIKYKERIANYESRMTTNFHSFMSKIPQYVEARLDNNSRAICGFLGALFAGMNQHRQNHPLTTFTVRDYIEYLMKNSGMGYEEAKKYFEKQQAKGLAPKGMIMS